MQGREKFRKGGAIYMGNNRNEAGEILVPQIIYIPWKLEPGEAAAVYGEGFDRETRLAVQPLTGYGGELCPETAMYQVSPVHIHAQYVQFIMPSGMPYDICAVWVCNAHGWSRLLYTNQPIMYWSNEHEVYPGQKLMLYMRNAVNPLSRSAEGAAVEFVERDSGGVLKAAITDVRDFQVFCTVPEGLKPGARYDIRYTNGAGGKYGWFYMKEKERETVTAVECNENIRYFDRKWDLQAAWVSRINTSNELNVKDFGAKGDGKTNDTEAVQAAVDRAEQDGGGVVFFPQGTYVVDFVNIGAYTILRGESRDGSIIKWSGDTRLCRAAAPRTTIRRSAIAIPIESYLGAESAVFLESNKVIYSDDPCVGLFDLSIVNDLVRPAEEESEVWYRNRMIFGYCEAVAFLGMDRSDDEIFPGGKAGPEGNGHILKNVRIRTADGGGAILWQKEHAIMEDCEVESTHGALDHFGSLYPRIRNNRTSGMLRSQISPGDTLGIWMEGNLVHGRDDMRRVARGELPKIRWGDALSTQEHRGTDFGGDEHLFVDNTFTGVFGDHQDNSGEGFQSQAGVRKLYTRMGEIGKDYFTALRKADHKVTPGDAVVITFGRGIGQHKKVKEATEDKIILTEEWDIVPDGTSIVSVVSEIQADVTFCRNTWNCNNNKGSIHFYQSGYNGAIVDNDLPDGGGIRMAAVHRQENVNIQYFHLIENNVIKGSTYRGNVYQGACTAIGSSNDGGIGTPTYAMKDKEMLSTLMYGIRILHNEMTGIATSIEDTAITKTGPKLDQKRSECSVSRYAKYSGIVLSTMKPGIEENIPFRLNVASVVEGNKVRNVIAGIHSSESTYDAILRNNDLTGNGAEIQEEGQSHNTMMLSSDDGKPAGVWKRAEIDKRALERL